MQEMILVDWTRMGKTYCLAGAVLHKGNLRIVRPLLAKNRDSGERKWGWWANLLAGRQRWEVLELVGRTITGPTAAAAPGRRVGARFALAARAGAGGAAPTHPGINPG